MYFFTLSSASSWLSFCRLDISTGRLAIGDAQFAMIPDMLVKLPVGRYSVEVKIIEVNGQRIVSRLRLIRAGTRGKLGRLLGETATDTAQTGVCDYDHFARVWVDFETSFEPIGEALHAAAMAGDLCGIAILDAHLGAVMPFVTSGFGDGIYPVFKVIAGSKPIGVEIRYTTVKKALRELAAVASAAFGLPPMPPIDLGSSAVIDDVANSVTTSSFAPPDAVDRIEVSSSDCVLGDYVVGYGLGGDEDKNSADNS
jgi:hypothetical protein